jgi:predicted DNA-binding transcriptional regulator AlpA
MRRTNGRSPVELSLGANGQTDAATLPTDPGSDRGQAPTAVPVGGEPILIDAKELGRLLGRSRASVDRDDAAGRIPRPLRIGGSRRWRLAEIRVWVDAGMPTRDVWEPIYKPNARR